MMINPALALDATMTVAEAREHLETYPAFWGAVVHRTVEGKTQWFAMGTEKVRRLLTDVNSGKHSLRH